MSDTEQRDCRWAGPGNPRTIKGRHEDDCARDACRGCLPCPERHCVICGINHSIDQTCPGCIGGVRDDINALKSMLPRLRTHALEGSTVSGSGAVKPVAAAPIPGGDAMVELGPQSNGSAATDRKQISDERVSPEPTVESTMSSWAQDWAESGGGHERTPWSNDDVTWAARSHPAFDDFAREVRRQRTRLEDLLHEGERSDTGAPCAICGRDLERVYGPTVDGDTWWCSRCKKSLRLVEYIEGVGQVYRANADWLTAEDIEKQHLIPAGSVRSWGSGSVVTRVVRKKRDPNTGRIVYHVQDAIDRRDRRSEDSA